MKGAKRDFLEQTCGKGGLRGFRNSNRRGGGGVVERCSDERGGRETREKRIKNYGLKSCALPGGSLLAPITARQRRIWLWRMSTWVVGGTTDHRGSYTKQWEVYQKTGTQRKDKFCVNKKTLTNQQMPSGSEKGVGSPSNPKSKDGFLQWKEEKSCGTKLKDEGESGGKYPHPKPDMGGN